MQLEISFNNLYHFYKEKYQENEKVHRPQIPISELDSSELFRDDNSYKESVYKSSSNIIIDDSNNEIYSIETNNPRCINISTKIKKKLFKKIKIYTITATGNGNIKIKYNNGKPIEIRSIYISQDTVPNLIDNVSQDTGRIKLGSLSGDQSDYWFKDDPFISNKYIECLYTYSTSKDHIQNHINICYKMGAECNFVCHNFDLDSLNNSEYISKYIYDFTDYISFIYNTKPKDLPCTLLFEPELLTYVYNSVNRNPNNIYIYNGDNKITLVQFISQMNTICTSFKIGFVNVINPSIYINLIYKITDTLDFDRYINFIKKKVEQLSNFLSYFNNENTKYLSFKVNSNCKLMTNDENMAYLHIVKYILEKLKLEGILFDIPVGHINGVESISKYTNKPFENHIDKPGDYQGTSTFFFFGGCAKLDKIKYRQNKFNDSCISVNGTTVLCDEHISLCDNFNIKYLMFGSTSIKDTTNVPLNSKGNKCTDHNYTICKISEYYNNKI